MDVSKTHEDNVSLFKFPTDIKLRRAWTLQVKRTRDRWDGPNERSTLCSDHFTVECFESMSILSKEMGLQRRTKLKPNAIPSIFPRKKQSKINKPDSLNNSIDCCLANNIIYQVT